MSNVIKKSIAIPKEVYSELEEGAKRDGVSFSQYIVDKIQSNTQKPIDPYSLDAKIDDMHKIIVKQNDLLLELFKTNYYKNELALLLLQYILDSALNDTGVSFADIFADCDKKAHGASDSVFKSKYGI